MHESRPIKSARHHWWPAALSKFWADAEGCVSWLKPDGTTVRAPPERIGAIRDGHTIRLADSAVRSPWDTSFEDQFQRPDNNFRGLIEWLEGLARAGRVQCGRFAPVDAPELRLAALMESLISLVVRSPRTREMVVAPADRLRGELSARERHTLIGANLLHMQETLVERLGTSGKFVLLCSPTREFVFGDGFFNNVVSLDLPHEPKFVIPLTPRFAVLFLRPMVSRPDPKMFVTELSVREVEEFNWAVGVYAKQMLLFCEDQPSISEHFSVGKHLRFSTSDNPVDRFMRQIPGVKAR